MVPGRDAGQTYFRRTDAPLDLSVVTSDGEPLTEIDEPLEASTFTFFEA